ncbi:uncharacterized protein ASCRUDRAFT_76342 [Ascoidea rubescens DSM 1968]|uniref:Uncharacterized protein n=1 Tax=Ascoidea rubescens DSM 1968 TaxID=1344418 RepID=A0A1D2VF75_9ASCO|nr:hypothetical protein ASCRUDRAFT_76342 [Ascoidea rubescens DSM 1968]ODV60338.1 hypothetical protein ASCRUDRAFT_76342 [Ascoidea rubescens DSM 1968]
MQFSRALLLAAAAAAVSAGYANTTVYDIDTTVITITSCESVTVCTEVPVTTGVTTVTETIKGTKTVYTTYCPLPEETESYTPPVSSSTKKGNDTVPEVETANGASKVAFGLGSVAAVAGLLLF